MNAEGSGLSTKLSVGKKAFTTFSHSCHGQPELSRKSSWHSKQHIKLSHSHSTVIAKKEEQETKPQQSSSSQASIECDKNSVLIAVFWEGGGRLSPHNLYLLWETSQRCRLRLPSPLKNYKMKPQLEQIVNILLIGRVKICVMTTHLHRVFVISELSAYLL